MKKLINQIKNYHPNRWYCVLFLLIPLIVASVTPWKVLDNDRFFLLSLGRSIMNNGLPVIDPLSMHHASFIAQQWLSDVLLYATFKYFGDKGLVVLTFLVIALLSFIYLKLCLLVSKDRFALSTLMTTIFSIGFFL